MGTNLAPIMLAEEISVEDLRHKRLAVDAFNLLYQFLTTVRQPDGTPLKDSRGNVTSHISGLFFRTTKLMESGLKLAFVFDGKSPVLKKEEQDRRKSLKQDALLKYKEAVEQQDVELMRKYAARTTYLTKEMVEESKELLEALGLPCIQAPSEGEAQAAYIVKRGDAYAVISQDTDSLLFGAANVVRNLNLSHRKKFRSTSKIIMPELINLEKNLAHLGLTEDQLIMLAILSGTDFNVGGVKGIGPKKGLNLVKTKSFEEIFSEVEWPFEYSWKEVFDVIKKMPITQDYKLEWTTPNKEKIIEIMVGRHEFSRDRVESSLSNLTKASAQKGLADFL